MRLVIHLKDILKQRGMTQKELSEKCGLREAALSEFANGTRTTINKEHLIKIANALNIRDIRELMSLED
ncbi:helix-turn-helix domain-containing protein [Fredinandcohnia humi]